MDDYMDDEWWVISEIPFLVLMQFWQIVVFTENARLSKIKQI